MTNTTFPYANDKFEEAAIKLIANARTYEQVRERFDGACTRCSLYDRQAECKTCPIRETVLAKAVDGWTRMRKEDYLWVDLERSAE